MNRSLANVILGGYQVPPPSTNKDAGPVEVKPHVETDVSSVAEALTMAKEVRALLLRCAPFEPCSFARSECNHSDAAACIAAPTGFGKVQCWLFG